MQIVSIMPADTDKPHRCPKCWTIPDIIWDSHKHARLWTTYICRNGHRFARWRRLPTLEELGLTRIRLWWLFNVTYRKVSR